MFASIRQRWAEARAEVLARDVAAVFAQLAALDRSSQRMVYLAFDGALSDLQEQLGSFDHWPRDVGQRVAKEVMAAAQRLAASRGEGVSAQMDRLNSLGGALLSFYSECHALPGPRAARLVRQVSAWHADEDRTNSGVAV